jgi:hypothetical protein
MAILKAKTAGTTVYYVNTETKEFRRIKGETSVTNLWFDGSWNAYYNDVEPTIGESLFFRLLAPMGGWQLSTEVSSIEEVQPEDLPAEKVSNLED